MHRVFLIAKNYTWYFAHARKIFFPFDSYDKSHEYYSFILSVCHVGIFPFFAFSKNPFDKSLFV